VCSGRFCIAIDPANPKGVWWWEPRKDCSTGSTGPRVFEAEQARVSRSEQTGMTDVSFRLGLITGPNSTSPPFADVRLVLHGGRLRASATGSEVATVHRKDLDVPEVFHADAVSRRLTSGMPKR